jgi:hypothetical protein
MSIGKKGRAIGRKGELDAKGCTNSKRQTTRIENEETTQRVFADFEEGYIYKDA